MGKARVLLLAIICCCLTTFLPAEITVTYVPKSYFNFKKGSEIQTNLTPLGTFSADKLVAHLGTLTITAVDEQLRRPLIHPYGFTTNLFLTGPFTDWGGGDQSTEFYLWAYSSVSPTPFTLWLHTTDALVDYSENIINVNPFVVDIFLVSHWSSSLYEVGSSYVLSPGSLLGSFNVSTLVIGPQGSRTDVFRPVNGQEIPSPTTPPSDPIPIVGSGEPGFPPTPPPPIIYGEDPPDPEYLLTIVQADDTFEIEDAYIGKPPVEIARLQLTLHHVTAANPKVDISFASTVNASGFLLRPWNMSPIDSYRIHSTSSVRMW